MNNPRQISQNYVAIAKTKTTMAWYKLIMLAILAGIFIAFGAVVSTFASASAEGGMAVLLKGAVFPVGLILVVVCGAELFTGNCLLISPAVSRDIKISGLFKNWGLVYLGNLIGSIIIAVLVIYSHVFSEDLAVQCIMTGVNKIKLTFGEVFIRGILCNMLVCLAVWASMASNNIVGKIAAVYLPIFTFVVAGFEHSVANMYYLSAALLAVKEYNLHLGMLTLGKAIINSLLPSTLGNMIGGFAIAMAYHLVYKTTDKGQFESDK